MEDGRGESQSLDMNIGCHGAMIIEDSLVFGFRKEALIRGTLSGTHNPQMDVAEAMLVRIRTRPNIVVVTYDNLNGNLRQMNNLIGEICVNPS